MPKAMGIIMDGNRRWARERGKPTLEGHRLGYEKTQDVARWAKEAGLQELTIYAFSTENWNRSEEEVSYLMNLFRELLRDGLKEVAKDGRIRIIGERNRFAADLQKQMHELEERTKEHKEFTLVVALSYGGRAEILEATRRLQESGATVNEESFKEHMWSAGLMDPDLIVRTGGEERLSGFLTWQSVYSELFFTNTLWPDLTKEEFLSILETYEVRERRMGK